VGNRQYAIGNWANDNFVIMSLRKIKGDKIFDGLKLIEGHVLMVSKDGIIEEIIPQSEAGDDVESFDGILTPGFINCHCHTELSHLKNKIPPGEGMINFLIKIVRGRKDFDTEKGHFIEEAEKEMWKGGIAGVGDICNTLDALPIKQKSKMEWRNFIEVINFYNENLEKQIEWSQQIGDNYNKKGLNVSLSPHAPYTVSSKTLDVINERTKEQIVSIHNQECVAEDDLFKNGTGDFLKFYNEFNNGALPFPVSGKSSLQTWLPHFTNGQTIISVHNTYIGENDIVFAKEHAGKYGLKMVYCLCPNANLYIENSLPPVDLFIKHNCTVVLGTDSYSSNWQLGIASEIKTLIENFPQLELQKVLKWATSSGAAIMQWDKLGSFTKGKKPGVVLFNEMNFLSQRLF